MTTKSQLEVIQAVEWAKREYMQGGLDAENERYEELYQLYEVPQRVSDELTRGKIITDPDTTLSQFVTNVVNQVVQYSTYPILTRQGDTMTRSEADQLEAGLAVWLSDIDNGLELRAEAYRGLLKDSHVIYQLIPGDYNDRFPFKVSLPRIDTTFFPRFRGGRPLIVGRDYEMLARDAEVSYSGRKGDHSGAGLKATWSKERQQMHYSPWEPVSGEYGDRARGQMTGTADYAELVRCRELYDGENCYHVIQGKGPGAKEQVVYQYPELTGGTPFEVVPGNPQGAQQWYRDWRPIAWPGYTLVRQLNRINMGRAIRSEQAQDHILMRLPPGDAEAVKVLKEHGVGLTLHPGVNFLPIPAEDVIPWTRMPDEDAVARAAEKREELRNWVSSWAFPATEQVMKDANVGNLQLGLSVVHSQEAGLVKGHNKGLAAMARMMLTTMAQNYPGDRTVYATDQMAYGRNGTKKLDAGASVTLKAQTMTKLQVYGQDYNVRVEVVTRQETEPELQAREASVRMNVQYGSQTFDDLLAVRNPDVTDAHARLLEDKLRKELADTFDAAIAPAAAEANRLRYGTDVTQFLAGAGGAPGGAAQATTGPAPAVRQGTPVPATAPVDTSTAGAPGSSMGQPRGAGVGG